MPPPTIELLQVQYLVQFIIGLVGELVVELGDAFQNLGLTLSTQAENANDMAQLTTGVFGTNSGLIYWTNEKVFYAIENLPWCDLGQGLGQLINGLLNPPPC